MEMTSSSPSPPAVRVFRPARLPSVLYGLGMLGIFLGERVVESGAASTGLTVVGLALTVLGTVLRALRLKNAAEAHKAPERALLGLYIVGLLSIALYFFNSSLFWRMTGKSLSQSLPRLGPIVGTLWPALWLCAALPIAFVELSLGAMSRAPVLDGGRVRSALMSALGLSFALVFVFCAVYVASDRDVKADLSYYRLARAGDSTKKIIQALDQPVTLSLFFPPANEVRDEVENYLADLTVLSKHLHIENYDQALHPSKARELGVSGNGSIVVSRGELREQIALPLQLQSAQSQLRSFDYEINKRLLAVTRKQRIAYFTRGHDERTFDSAGENDKRATIRTLKTLLIDQRFDVKDLSAAEGLGTDIPKDATIVFIIGPKRPFLPEESAALVRYLDRQGRLFIALDPENGVTMPEVLSQLSLKYEAVPLAHTSLIYPKAHEEIDKLNVVSRSFSSHVSVSTIGRRTAAVIFIGAGYVEKAEKGAVGIVNVDFTVHADPGTWADRDGDLKPGDPQTEPRKAYELAAAVSKRNASALHPEDEARAVVIADSDAVADEFMRNMGNGYLAYDGIRWLGGEERFTGQVNNEEDVPIVHTRKQDTLWFYSSVFAAPALVLGLGFAMNRRGRRGRSSKAAKPEAQP